VKIFFLDLASHEGTLACIADGAAVHVMPVDHRIDDALLTGLIEQTLKDAGWSYQDLQAIACITGPGGFTSLRVAVAAANALASFLAIPAVGIHLSDLYAARRQKNQEDVWWIHSTKKAEVFLRGFGSFAALLPEPTWMPLAEAVEKIGDAAWMGELIPEHRAQAEAKGAHPIELLSIKDVLPALLLKQTFQKELVLPWYGRGW